MNRITLAIITIAAIAVPLTLPSVAHAAASCSVTSPGTPVVSGTNNNVVTVGGQGKCNVKWDAIASLQYESGGSWFNASSGDVPFPPQPVGPYGGGVQHATNWSWSNGDQVPYCSFNLRALVQYVEDSNGTVIYSRYTSQRAKSC